MKIPQNSKKVHKSFVACKLLPTFARFLSEGKMLEWLKRHAWKACKLQKGFRGSNPRLSAK